MLININEQSFFMFHLKNSPLWWQPTNDTTIRPSVRESSDETESTTLTCNTCSKEINTQVNSQVTLNGKVSAVLSIVCGCWFLGLLIFFMDGFKVFRHYCPECKVLVAEYKPPLSVGLVCFLIILSLAMNGLIVGPFLAGFYS